MKYFISTSFVIAITFVVCIGDNVHNNNRLRLASTISCQKQGNIELEVFTTLPKEIDGCGCYFFLTAKDKQEGKYICVNNFANLAFLSVNGKLERFEITEHKENSNNYLYSNKTFTLKIEIIKKESGGEETSNIEGVITIKSKEGRELRKIFIGFCGC